MKKLIKKIIGIGVVITIATITTLALLFCVGCVLSTVVGNGVSDMRTPEVASVFILAITEASLALYVAFGGGIKYSRLYKWIYNEY